MIAGLRAGRSLRRALPRHWEPQAGQRWLQSTAPHVDGAAAAAQPDMPPNLTITDPDVMVPPPPPADYRHKPSASMQMPVRSLADPEAVVGEVMLDATVFCTPVRPDILHRVVRWQRAKRQQGTHKVKTISERSGSGKKPLPQKGSGRARQGSRRAPHMRGGGRVFGPTPRSHAHKLNKKVRNFGLRSALAAKWLEGNLMVVDTLAMEQPKTRLVQATIDAYGWTKAFVVDGEEVDAGFARASRNLKCINPMPQMGCNVMDLLRAEQLVITTAGLEQLQARLVTGMKRKCGRIAPRSGGAVIVDDGECEEDEGDDEEEEKA